MKNVMGMIANGDKGAAIKAYAEEIREKDWMNEVNEEDIYESLRTSEFSLFMEVIGLGNDFRSLADAA